MERNLFLPELVDGRGAIQVGRRHLDPGAPGAAVGGRCVLREGEARGRQVRLAWRLPAHVAISPIRTVAQTEAGFDMTCQGHGLVVAWPVGFSAGGTRVVDITMQVAGKE